MNSDDSGLTIDPAQAKAKLESGTGVALDVVQPGTWEQLDGAVEGAVRIPPDEIAQRFEELPRELDIITYCT